MYLTNEEPSPRSRRLKEVVKTLSRTQEPNSLTSRWCRMYGVSRRVTMKLHDRPTTLKNVFVTSFFENSPRNVTGGDCSGLVLILWVDIRRTAIAAVTVVFAISQEKMISKGPIIMPVEQPCHGASAPLFFPSDDKAGNWLR